MKKNPILISISAALLLCAVICTAGCVEAPSDPIVGTYVTETDSAVSYAVFENDGTGCFAAAAETGEDAWVLTGTCSWAAADSKNTYTLLFADGETETAVLNAEHGLMTIGGVEYQKYPSGFSGVVVVGYGTMKKSELTGAQAKEALLESAGESAVPMSTEEQIGWAPSAVGVSSPVQLPWRAAF